jgi:GNAT superfamily N-acetyltransferase
MLPVQIERLADPQPLSELLLSTTWGSEGLRYRVRSIDWSRVPTDRETIFLAARSAERGIVGAYALVEDTWGYYRLLLAVDPQAQRQGIARALLMKALASAGSHPTYGAIELDNSKSLALMKSLDLPHTATLLSHTFTRARPRSQPHVRHAHSDELPHIAELVLQQNLVGFSSNMLRPNELFVTDDLAAGMQICRHHWVLSHLGLPLGLDPLARVALPLLGISPRDFQFAFAHFWFGNPSQWAALLEHALSDLKLQAVTAVGDPRGQPWNALCEHVDFGLVDRLLGPGRTAIVTSGMHEPPPMHFSPLNGI